MTKDIMLRISGVQFPDGEENSEEMEVITSGSYFEKDGRHYIKYDEVQEDSNEVIRNLLKIENGSLELTRRGMTNVHMVFEKDKKKRILLRHPIWKIPGRDLRNTSGCQRKRRQH